MSSPQVAQTLTLDSIMQTHIRSGLHLCQSNQGKHMLQRVSLQIDSIKILEPDSEENVFIQARKMH